MEFTGTFTLDDTTTDAVWLALSDPNLVWDALPGCQFLVRVDEEEPDFEALDEEYAGVEPDLTADPDEIESRAFEEGATYAALVELSVGSVSPSFQTTVTIDEREQPRMAASGEGSAGNSSFEMYSWMELTPAGDDVDVEWHAEADVFGRIAQMGQRMINPVANRVVKRFFQNVQGTLDELTVEAESEGDDGAGGADGRMEAADDTHRDETGGGDDGTADRDTREESTTSTPETAVDAKETDGSDGADGVLAKLKRLLGIGG